MGTSDGGEAAPPRGVPRVIASSLVARLPLGMSSIALLLLARYDGYSFGVAGGALAAFGFANAAAAPFQGALVDRTGQTLVLGVTAACQAALLLLFALATPKGATLALIGLAAAIGALAPPTTACLRALLTAVVTDPRRLERLFSVDAIGTEAVWATGPLIVAGVVAVASPRAAILAMACFSVLGTAVFMSSSLSRGWRPSPSRARRSRAGALAVPGLNVVLASIVLQGIAVGAFQVGLTALALRIGSGSLAGVLLALWSAGSMAGGFAYFARTWQSEPGHRYGLLLTAVLIGTAPLLAVESVWLVVPLTVAAGVGVTPTIACQNTLIGFLVPSSLVTEAFTWNMSGIFGGIAVGSGLGGLLTEGFGFRGPIALSLIAIGLAAAVALRWRHRLTTRPSTASPPPPVGTGQVLQPASVDPGAAHGRVDLRVDQQGLRAPRQPLPRR